MEQSKRKKDEAKLRVYAPWRNDENYKYKKKKSFVALPHSFLMNDVFLSLTPKAQIVYIYMTDYANGQQTTTFPQSAYSKIISNQGFINAKEELKKHGFIEEVANGRFTRTENIYGFIEKWKTSKPRQKKKKDGKNLKQYS